MGPHLQEVVQPSMLLVGASLLCFALGQRERAVPFPRSREQPRPPFWVTGSAVRGTGCGSKNVPEFPAPPALCWPLWHSTYEVSRKRGVCSTLLAACTLGQNCRAITCQSFLAH